MKNVKVKVKMNVKVKVVMSDTKVRRNGKIKIK
jgi:hypothetical protein